MSRRVRLKRDVEYMVPTQEYRQAWMNGKGDTHRVIKKGTILTVAHEADEEQEIAVYYRNDIVFLDSEDVEPAPDLPPEPTYKPDDEIPF